MTKRPEPLCYLVIDTEYVDHWSQPGNKCFAFAATAFRPLKTGESVFDKETRRKALISSQVFHPRLDGDCSGGSSWKWWQEKERVELFQSLIACATDTEDEMRRFMDYFNELKKDFKRVEVCAWPATVDQPVVEKLIRQYWPNIDPFKDWVLSWKCIR
jgi:hypothetical protein